MALLEEKKRAQGGLDIRMPSSTSSDRQTIAATIILRRNENTGQDEVFLEERLDTAVGGGTIGIVGGKLDQKDVDEVKERCCLEGLELTPSQFSDDTDAGIGVLSISGVDGGRAHATIEFRRCWDRVTTSRYTWSDVRDVGHDELCDFRFLR
eukprot:COSAG01_NODE_5723_length_4074_cov_49.724277_4_plen_152_part_00